MVGIWSADPVDTRTCMKKFSDALEKPIMMERSFNQYSAVFFHLFDLISDITYITAVPIYSNAIFGVMVTSMVSPIIPLFYQSYLQYKQNGDLLTGFILFAWSYIGIYDIFKNGIEGESVVEWKLTKLIEYLLSDTNLERDEKFKGLIKAHKQGYVDLKNFLDDKQINDQGIKIEQIARVIKYSNHLDLSADGKSVRRARNQPITGRRVKPIITTAPENMEESVKKSLVFRSYLMIIFAFLEDVPQFSLQTLNSLYIGQTLTFIQLASPTITFLSLNHRLASNTVLNWSEITLFGCRTSPRCYFILTTIL